MRKDFYLVEDSDGRKSDRVEDLLAQIEGEGAAGLRALVDESEWPISLTTRLRVAAWLALQYLRTPSVRQAMDELADQTLKLDIAVQGRPGARRVLEHDLGRDPTQDEVDDLWQGLRDFDSYTVSQHPNEHIRLMLSELQGHTRVFLARSWSVFRFQRRGLITCDNPVVPLPPPGHPEALGVGLLNAGEIVVPLDRRVALIMRDIPDNIEAAGYGTADGLLNGTTRVASFVSQAVAWHAREAIYSHPEDLAAIPRDLPSRRAAEVDPIDLDEWVAIGEKFASHFGPDDVDP